MGTAHKVPNSMSCPKCKNVEGFSSKKRQRDHIPNCKELEGKSTKKFGCDFVGCGKRYKTQQALNTHKAEAHNPDKIEEQAELQFICEHCAQDFATKGSLTRHIKGNTRTSELMLPELVVLFVVLCLFVKTKVVRIWAINHWDISVVG